jgi:hypothetical protein
VTTPQRVVATSEGPQSKSQAVPTPDDLAPRKQVVVSDHARDAGQGEAGSSEGIPQETGEVQQENWQQIRERQPWRRRPVKELTRPVEMDAMHLQPTKDLQALGRSGSPDPFSTDRADLDLRMAKLRGLVRDSSQSVVTEVGSGIALVRLRAMVGPDHEVELRRLLGLENPAGKSPFLRFPQGEVTPPSNPGQGVARARQLSALCARADVDVTGLATNEDFVEEMTTYVGEANRATVLSALGVHTQGTVAHLGGAEADFTIQEALGAVPHLKTYLEEAVQAGKRGAGGFAVVGGENFDKVYASEFGAAPTLLDGSSPMDRARYRMDKEKTNAFIATKSAGSPAMIHADRGSSSTAIHEAMHRYAEDAIFDELRADFNEGVTEYFTRLVTDDAGDPPSRGGRPRSNYQKELTFVKNVMLLLVPGTSTADKEVSLARMYFKGESALLKDAFILHVKGFGLPEGKAKALWPQLKAALMTLDKAGFETLMVNPGGTT